MYVLNRRHFMLNTTAALAAVVLPVNRVKAENTAGASPQEHQVEIQKFKFSPAVLTVRPGDTITWLNRDIAPHTATAKDRSWDTGTIKNMATGSIVVTADTATSYYCRFHPMMKAELKLVVVE